MNTLKISTGWSRGRNNRIDILGRRDDWRRRCIRNLRRIRCIRSSGNNRLMTGIDPSDSGESKGIRYLWEMMTQ